MLCRSAAPRRALFALGAIYLMTTAGQSDTIPLGNFPVFAPDKKMENQEQIAHDPIELIMLFKPGKYGAGVYHSFFVPFVYNWDVLTMWTGDPSRIPLDIPWLENREDGCAAGPIGCKPAKDTENGLFALRFTAWRQLDIDANQPHQRPEEFGPMQAVIPVREGETLVMLGSCVIVLGLLNAFLPRTAGIRPEESPTCPTPWIERWRR
jgi:hypothetical protein